MASMLLLSQPRGRALHLHWDYGHDLTGVEITATVSSPDGEIGRLRVLSCEDPAARDLVATAADTASWPVGRVAIDISLRRGDTAGRLDTFFIGMTA